MSAEVIRLPSASSAAASDLETVFARLASIPLATPFGRMLQDVAQLAAEAIPAADDVSVAVLDRGRVVGVGFAGSRLGAALDERQHRVGFGPSFDTARTGRVVLIRDTGHGVDYQDFARLAHDHGVGHVLALPLLGTSADARDVTGSLTVYSAPDRVVDEALFETAERFAQAAASTVSNAVLYIGATLQAAQLQEAMVSRAVIEQAKGVIMATEKCTAESAFDQLRDASTRSNRKLREIAASIVRGAST